MKGDFVKIPHGLAWAIIPWKNHPISLGAL
jgi:hypothetical protein